MEVIVYNAPLKLMRESWQVVLKTVDGELDSMADQAERILLNPTKDWKKKPTFSRSRSTFQRSVYTYDKPYVWVSQGTHRSGWTSSPNGMMWLPTDYDPKTVPLSDIGTPGRRVYTRGRNVRRSVPKSSIRAREFDRLAARIILGIDKSSATEFRDWGRDINEAVSYQLSQLFRSYESATAGQNRLY